MSQQSATVPVSNNLALAATSPNSVIGVDSDGNVTVFNDQARDLLMYQPEDVLGKSVGPLYGDPKEPRKIGKLLHKSPDGKLIGHETFVCARDGEHIPIRLAATWLLDAKGKRIGSVGHFEDLRTTKKVEKHLAKLLKTYNFVTRMDNSETSLQSLAEMMVTLFKVAFCRIFLVDDERQFMTARAVRSVERGGNGLDWRSGLGEQTALADWPGLSDFISQGDELVLRTGKRGAQILEEWSRRLSLKDNIQSLHVIPLRTKDQVIGLLEMGELRSWDRAPFSSENRELAVAMGSKIAELIDHLRVHEITERRKQLLTALDERTLELRGEKEPSRLLHEVVRRAAEIAGCLAGGLYINHPNLKELVLSVVYNLPENLLESRLSHSGGLIGQVAQTHKCKIVRNWPNCDERENILEPFGFNTVIAIPLEQAGEVDAVLFVADPTDLPGFIDSDLEILERFVAQASIALETSRLISPEQRRVAQLQILYQINHYIHTAKSLDKILHIVLTGITAGYGLGFNRAVLLEKDGEYLVGRMGIGQFYEDDAWAAWKEEKLLDFPTYIDRLEEGTLPKTPLEEIVNQLRYRVDSEADVFSRVVLGQETDSVLVLPANQLEKLPSDFCDVFKPTSPVVVIPLKAGSQVLGLLVADNKFTLSPITLEVKELLLTLVNTAAMVIDKVKLDAQLYERANKRASALSALSEAAHVLTSLLDEEEILNRIAEQAWHVANSQGNQCGIADVRIVDRKNARLLAAYPPEELLNSRATLGKEMDLDQGRDGRIGIIGRAVKCKHSVLVGDVTQDSDYLEHHGKTRSEMAVPILIGDEVIGVINIEHFDYNAFDEEDQQVIECLAAQASIAIQNARRYKEMKETQMYVGSRTAVDWMKVIAQRSWHRLHNEVHRATGQIVLIEDAVKKAAPPEQLLSLLKELTVSLLDLPNDPMILLLQAQDVIAPAEINDFLDTVLDRIWQKDRTNGGMLAQMEVAIDFQQDLDDKAIVRISQMHLQHVLTILIENSARAMSESASSEKRILVSTRLANEKVEVSISDTGCGVPFEMQKTIFVNPITKEQGRHGAGMGCVTACRLLDLFEGKIALKSSGDDGTTVVISLPIQSR